MATGSGPQTLQQAILFFSDYANCHEAVKAIRWPDGVVRCPRCGSDRVTYLAAARVWKCYGSHPKAKFSLKVGTVFEDSPLPLQKWLPALWLLMNCKNGISSYELGRALGVTQKTAWFMLSRLRLALQDKWTGGKMRGHVEVDETFIGGKARNMHRAKRERLGISQSKSMIGKVAVMGLLQRHTDGSTVRFEVIRNRKRHQLETTIAANVEGGANVYSDALKSYDRMGEKGYVHHVIDHAEKYADGQVHTNGLENFWSLLKRAIKGTYISVEPFHLFRYLDEQAFRFNNRKMTDAARFVLGLKGILGRRLTYIALTGSELPETC
jgi:transposase-like protein